MFQHYSRRRAVIKTKRNLISAPPDRCRDYRPISSAFHMKQSSCPNIRSRKWRIAKEAGALFTYRR